VSQAISGAVGGAAEVFGKVFGARALRVAKFGSRTDPRAATAGRAMLDAEELELVERLKRRDEAAFNAFVLRYQDRVFRVLLRMIGDRAEAEDLAQEVFISIFKAIESFRGDSQLSTWVYRVAANHCRNRLKYLARRRRQLTDDFDEESVADAQSVTTPDRQGTPDRLLEARQTEALLEQGLSRLDDEQRELVVLREVEHLSYEEIMAITGLPEGTVKSRLHRARSALREHLERAERGGRGSAR
jgi:RNA polymerase sigma-70 factor (ECF subfamily)